MSLYMCVCDRFQNLIFHLMIFGRVTALENWLADFYQTLQKWSVAGPVVHIISMFLLQWFLQS